MSQNQCTKFKNPRNWLFETVALVLKTLNILAIYLSANFAIALCSRVAFFPCDGNAIISENFIVIAGEKLLV